MLMSRRVALAVLRHRKSVGDWKTGWELSKKLLLVFPDCLELKDEASLMAYYSGDIQAFTSLTNDILDRGSAAAGMLDRIYNNKRFALASNVSHELASADLSYRGVSQTLPFKTPFSLVVEGPITRHVRRFLYNTRDAHLLTTVFQILEPDEAAVADSDARPVAKSASEPLLLRAKGPLTPESFLSLFGERDEAAVVTPYILFFPRGSWVCFDRRAYCSLTRAVLDTDPHYGQVFLNQHPSMDLTHPEALGRVKHTPGGARFFETNEEFSLQAPSMIASNTLYEHDFPIHYLKNKKSARLAGTHITLCAA
jgi:hypothetical protein